MMRPWPVIAAMILAVGGLSAVAGYEMAQPAAAPWREIAWPFPRDGWPAGRAFRCGTAECGTEVEVYLRPKRGFCNCDSGVADDDEVDRVADVDMISPRFVPLKAGDAVDVADMRGRIRPTISTDIARRSASQSRTAAISWRSRRRAGVMPRACGGRRWHSWAVRRSGHG